jgi:predicted aldo/keto reductase-like oxidoreductase
LKYRRFGKTDWMVSALGFGAMRLPVIGNDRGNIDEIEAIRMIRYAVNHGVNYIDTAYPYHLGNSELIVGKALENGYRSKVRLATKMPTWLVNSHADMNKYLEEQLTKLRTNHIDFYLLHGLNKERWDKLLNINVFKWVENTLSEGKIKFLGFSFHDSYEVFKEIIDGYKGWTFCQILYNYMSTDYQAGKKGLVYAASKGLGVVVMEPIAGGMLAVKPPLEVQAIWDSSNIKRTPAEWALQWVWNHPEVSLVLSGMSTMEQVIENVESANRSGLNILEKNELEIISRVQKKYLEYGFIGCTECGYCLPCPEGVAIPDIFSLCNEYYKKRGDQESQNNIKKHYSEEIPVEGRALKCVKCRECEDKCPQQLSISSLISRAARIFESSNG